MTLEAQALAMFFTEMLYISEEKSAEFPVVEENNFEVELMTFRVKRNSNKRILERRDENTRTLDCMYPRCTRCMCVFVLP